MDEFRDVGVDLMTGEKTSNPYEKVLQEAMNPMVWTNAFIALYKRGVRSSLDNQRKRQHHCISQSDDGRKEHLDADAFDSEGLVEQVNLTRRLIEQLSSLAGIDVVDHPGRYARGDDAPTESSDSQCPSLSEEDGSNRNALRLALLKIQRQQIFFDRELQIVLDSTDIDDDSRERFRLMAQLVADNYRSRCLGVYIADNTLPWHSPVRESQCPIHHEDGDESDDFDFDVYDDDHAGKDNDDEHEMPPNSSDEEDAEGRSSMVSNASNSSNSSGSSIHDAILAVLASGDDAPVSNEQPRRGIPPKAKAYLTEWFENHWQHPYPSKEEKQLLSIACDLTMDQVSRWFSYTRSRRWKPLLQQMIHEKHTFESLK